MDIHIHMMLYIHVILYYKQSTCLNLPTPENKKKNWTKTNSIHFLCDWSLNNQIHVLIQPDEI